MQLISSWKSIKEYHYLTEVVKCVSDSCQHPYWPIFAVRHVQIRKSCDHQYDTSLIDPDAPASHDLVMIFLTWSCISWHKLFQSHLLRNFHKKKIESVSHLWCCMSCILLLAYGFNPFSVLQSVATDDRKQYKCQNILLNINKYKLGHYFCNSIDAIENSIT